MSKWFENNMVLIIGLIILSGTVTLFYFNWNSANTLGAIGRVFGGLLMLPGGVLTFDGIAKGRTLYLSGKINGKEQSHPFWHGARWDDDKVNIVRRGGNKFKY
jgi:hypothetical protein